MYCNALQWIALLPSIYSWEELTLGLSIWTEKSEVGGTKVEEEEGTVLVVWSQTIPLDKIWNMIKLEYVQYGAIWMWGLNKNVFICHCSKLYISTFENNAL